MAARAPGLNEESAGKASTIAESQDLGQDTVDLAAVLIGLTTGLDASSGEVAVGGG